jgi:hypothetical protein
LLRSTFQDRSRQLASGGSPRSSKSLQFQFHSATPLALVSSPLASTLPSLGIVLLEMLREIVLNTNPQPTPTLVMNHSPLRSDRQSGLPPNAARPPQD